MTLHIKSYRAGNIFVGYDQSALLIGYRIVRAGIRASRNNVITTGLIRADSSTGEDGILYQLIALHQAAYLISVAVISRNLPADQDRRILCPDHHRGRLDLKSPADTAMIMFDSLHSHRCRACILIVLVGQLVILSLCQYGVPCKNDHLRFLLGPVVDKRIALKSYLSLLSQHHLCRDLHLYVCQLLKFPLIYRCKFRCEDACANLIQYCRAVLPPISSMIAYRQGNLV